MPWAARSGYWSEPVADLQRIWKLHVREVRRLHEKLFYRPLLAAVARIPGEESRLTPEAARDRLNALGFVDPAAALRHLAALTEGVSRRAAIQRTLLPVMLALVRRRARTRTPACSPSVRCPTRWAPRRGTYACSATRA